MSQLTVTSLRVGTSEVVTGARVLQNITSGNVTGALTVGTTLFVGTSVSAGTSGTGDIVIPNARALRSVNPAGINTVPLIYQASTNAIVIGTGSSVVQIGAVPVGDLAAAGSQWSGGLLVDTSNGRLVYYAGGNRYHLTGTAF